MNTLRREVAWLSGFVLVAAGISLAPGVMTPATAAADVIQDGGFEAATGEPLDSPAWVEKGAFPLTTPICNVDYCSGTATSPPRTGAAWAWFGGLPVPVVVQSLAQTLVIPTGTASLTYYYRNSTVGPDYATGATLTVTVDSVPVRTHVEASTPDPAYTLQTVDLSAYADGASHTISFDYEEINDPADPSTTSMLVDDVSLVASGGVSTGTPTITAAVPAGPSTSTTPKITGTAESGSTVTLYSNNTCTSAALGTGPAATFATTGITATVPANSTTTIYAQATKPGQGASPCSTTTLTYISDSTAPDTTITSSPAGGVATSLTVPIAFTSTETPSTFTCSLDTAAFTTCTNPASLTVAPGQHTFRVAARDASGNADTTPASVSFTAYDCATSTAAVAAAQAKAKAAAKAVAKAKKVLKKAKKSGKPSTIKKATKKLKKAKTAKKAADAALTAVSAASAPCGGTPARTIAPK